MAKSKLIKSLVSNEISLNEAMDRLLLIAMELNDYETICWLKNEKNGYAETNVPSYRVVIANPIGDYQMINYGKIMICSRKILPTVGVPEDIQKGWKNFPVRDSLVSLIEQKKSFENGLFSGIPIPPEMYYMFEKDTNIQVLSAFLTISEFTISSILDSVKTKILELLILYEKNFGDIDEFDININDYKKEELKELLGVSFKIINENYKGNIYIINSKIKNSNIGEKNKISKSSQMSIETNIKKDQEKSNIFKKIFSILKK